jgi:hypothetical protein
MDTFQNIHRELSILELRNMKRLRRSFSWTPEIATCLSGSAQFFAVDNYHRESIERLPLICAVGINYTQERRGSTSQLVHYLPPDDASVIDNNAGSRRAIGYVLAAYNRNRAAWETKTPSVLTSPLGFYGSKNVTEPIGLTSSDPKAIKDHFILVMTNVLPFITQDKWQDQVRRTPNACERLVRLSSAGHLDDLLSALGSSIDLWIGHSSIHGTAWVWPTFAEFVQRTNIQQWLLTGNISGLAHRYFDDEFRKRAHQLFSWYGPEREV